MALGFIWGRMPADRTKKVLDLAFEEAKSKSKKPIYILVPEKYTYEMEKKLSQRLLSQDDPNFRIRVVSFSTLSNIVFTNVSGLKEKKISRSARTMLVYRALEKSEKDLKTFRPSLNDLGLVAKLLDLVIEFKQNDMDVDYINSLSSKVDDRALASKLDDISRIYGAYEDLMQDKYMDSEDGTVLFSRLIGSYEPLDGASIFIDEFTGFTPVQYLVIEKLILLSKKIYISLMTDMRNINSYRGVFAKTNSTIMKINKFCIDNKVKRLEDIRVDDEEYYKKDELRFLESEIRFFNPKIYTGDTIKSSNDELSIEEFGNNKLNIDNSNDDELSIDKFGIKISSFENRHREVEYIASVILDLVKNKGYRFGQIMVATRDIDSYAHITKSIFDDYKINYFLDDKISAQSNPVLVFILSILDMKNTNYSYKSMFTYLKSGILDLDGDDIALLENYVLANGIRGKKWFEDRWDLPVVHSVEDNPVDIEVQDRINKIKDLVMEPIIRLNEKLKGKNTLRDISSYLYEFTLDIGLDKKIVDLVETFEREEDNYRAREYSQAWNIFVDVLDEMVEFMGDEVIGIERYIKFLDLQFQGHELGIIPPSRDQVFITGVDRMKNPDTRVLILIGTNEGVFPKMVSDTSLITEMDKSNLLEKGVKFDSDIVSKMYDEEFLVYRAMSTARERLYITYPKGDVEGNSMMASSLVNKIRKIFPQISEEDLSDQVYDIGFKLGDREIDFSQDKTPKISIDIADLIYGTPIFSVSKLEKFSSCPYSYFARYGLRARPRDVYEFSPMDAGNYYHKVLELFLRRIRSNDISWADVDLSYINREVEVLGSRILDARSSYILNTSEKYRYMVRRLNRTLVDSIDAIGKQVRGGKLRPKVLEVTFGIKSDLEPIRLKIDGAREGLVNGKIDRVDSYIDQDTNTEYISIVDYKLSSHDVDLEMVEAGIQLQLFMYMNAILYSKRSEFTRPGIKLKPAALLYSRVKSPQVKLSDIGDLDDLIASEAPEILRENKLMGIVVKDVDIYKIMDRGFEDNTSMKSDILPIKLNKNGTFPKKMKGYDEEEFDIISKYVIKKSEEIAGQIYKGNIDVRPYKSDGRTGCDYCEYRAICQFEEDEYRRIRKEEDIINRMTLYNFNNRKKGEDNGK